MPKTASAQHHDAAPTRIPAPVSILAPSVFHNQVAKPNPKSRAAAKPQRKAKKGAAGKSKATVWDSTDDTENDGREGHQYDDEDEAYLTSHDFDDEPTVPAKRGVNGTHVDGSGGGGGFVDGAS